MRAHGEQRPAGDPGATDDRDEITGGRVDRVDVALPTTVARPRLDLLVDHERDHLRVVDGRCPINME
ncbi:hypothetical protein Drose_32120 [Dactylosporangium roseum]|uniref:Uncharacterized protein n=1 Tax=Dactylosporangium roseum TaxID=47989 RepID=A0ABY5Z120_9ACTN|nr:hypothetical protein [Dactylosporangium roseum]UWZ35708.1 hypothetical protein Drose_32120 [Dactylosporangium roseum]